MAKKVKRVRRVRKQDSSEVSLPKMGIIILGAALMVIALFIYSEHQKGVLAAATIIGGGDGGGYASSPSQKPSSPTPIKAAFSLWIPGYNHDGNIIFKWERVAGAKYYRLVGTYGQGGPLNHYFDIASTTSNTFTAKSSKVFSHGKNLYYFQVVAYTSSGNKSSNLANIIRK